MKAHLINCTYCVNRIVTPGNKKRSIPELEHCARTKQPLKHPSLPGRYCQEFHQIGHDCAQGCYS